MSEKTTSPYAGRKIFTSAPIRLAKLWMTIQPTRATFDEWLVDLEAAHAAAGHPYGDKRPLVDTTGAECWLGYYEDGYDASDALAEDLSHGD